MSPQDKKDARLALIVVGIALLLGVWIGRASACDSYEECMDMAKKRIMPEMKTAYATIAMAHKLNEISKKLDKTEGEKRIGRLDRGLL